MSFKEAIKSVFSKYATFSGRARRSEYWSFVLFCILVSIVLTIIDRLLIRCGLPFPLIYKGYLIGLNTIWTLAVLIPSLAVTVRRLHDTGKSGWYFLLFLIPFILFAILSSIYGIPSTDLTAIDIVIIVLDLLVIVTGIILLVWLCRDSDADANRWGWNPKFLGERDETSLQ